jgi:hypothetical protein
MKEKIVLAILISLSFFPVVSASINCPNCFENENCGCTVNDCANGLVDIYSSANCVGAPTNEYSFGNGGFSWFPDSAGTYYALALCDDKHSSMCSEIYVSPAENVNTETSSSTTTTSSSSGVVTTTGNSNVVLYALVIVIIAVIVFIVYRLFSKKSKPKINYETLYRKWGR